MTASKTEIRKNDVEIKKYKTLMTVIDYIIYIDRSMSILLWFLIKRGQG
jgi:hypothetical protein